MALVVKCGSGVNEELVARDIKALREPNIVLVHGGADEIDALGAALGIEQQSLVSPDGTTARRTNAATLDVVMMALTGRVKPRWLMQLARNEVPAVGLTGLDASLLRAVRKRAHRSVVDGRTIVIRDDRSGRLESVNDVFLRQLLAFGLVPVISPPAIDEEGSPVNVDADRVAAAIAIALGAPLLFLTDGPGVLATPTDERSVISELVVDAEAAVSGGMRTKLAAARAALEGGVPDVRIADGRVERPVLRALDGSGTRILIGES